MENLHTQRRPFLKKEGSAVLRSKMPAYSRQAVGNSVLRHANHPCRQRKAVLHRIFGYRSKKAPMAAIQPVMAFLNRALENSKEK
ncbi:MAG: hypothetical protein ACLVEL_11990 [Ruthenibacterium sp.]